MADLKISALTSASTPLAGTEVLPIVQSSATVKVATNDLTVRNVRANATTGILQVTGPTAASTRVMTVPDANFTAARTDAAQSFTGNQTLSTGNLVIGTSGKGIDFSAGGGDVFTQIGGSITLAGGATGTLFTPGSGEGYLVTVAPSSGDSNSSGACLVISRYGSSLPVLATIGVASLVFTASGGALQITNGTAFSFDYDWTAVKLIH